MDPQILKLIEKLKLIPSLNNEMSALKQIYLTNLKLRPEVKKEIRKKLATIEDSGVDLEDRVFVLGRWKVNDFVRKYLEVVL